jgi:LuxR family quorum sensing-dependent transcriptional regulator
LTNSVPLFQKTLANISRAQNNQSVLRALKSLTETFGLDYIYITQFVNPARGVPDAWLRIHNWPSQLIQERIGKNVFKKDPLYRKAIKAHLPFSWQEARDEADPEGLEVLKQAEKYGLIEGWLIPIRSDELPVGGVSLGGAVCTTTSGDLEMICEAATHAYTRIFVLSGKSKTPPVERLSQREAEILTLIAEGCKNEEAAQILGIGRDAIKDALTRCYRKLGASSRADAVALALQSGQIFPFTGIHTPIG